MGQRRLGPWAAAAAVAGALTWAAYRGPPSSSAPPLPPPLPRPPTDVEWAEVTAQAKAMSRAVLAGQARTGTLPTVSELEGRDPGGVPWLPDGIPDNLLVPGVGTVGAACTPEHESHASPDWWYCAQTGRFRPGGLQSGNG